MKLIILCLGISVCGGVYAIPTIAMPNLVLEKTLQQAVPLTSANGSETSVELPITIKKELSTFSADIRGALIKTGQFRVVDIKNPKLNNLASLDDVFKVLKIDNPVEAKGDTQLSSDDSSSELENAATKFADTLMQSGKLDKCVSYALQDGATTDATEFNKAFLTELSNAPEFSQKFIMAANTEDGVVESNTQATKVAECNLNIQITSKSIVTNGISNQAYTINMKLVKSADRALLWQQQTKVNTATDYYLVGIISSINENEDSYPIKGTDNMTKQYFVEVAADFKLVRARDKTIMASFSATGRGSDVKIVSQKNLANTAWHHNVGKISQDAALDLAQNVVSQLQDQFGFMQGVEQKAIDESKVNVVTDVKEYK